MRPRLSMRGYFFVMCACVGLAACSIPEGDQSTPSGAHYLWLTQRAAGAGSNDALWELLDPGVKGELQAWLDAEKATVTEIKAGYTKDEADKALAVIGGGSRADAKDARVLFDLIVRPAPEGLGTLGAVAAHVRSEDIASDGNSATLRTFGGDEVALVRGEDGKWYVTLPPADLERLRNTRRTAEENLARVRANLKKRANPK